MSRINYKKFVYCAGCKIQNPKIHEARQRCPNCGLDMRRTPCNRIYMEKEVKRY